MNCERSTAAMESAGADSSWRKTLSRYQTPAAWRSTWQIVNTLIPYALLWYLMYRSLSVSYWLTLPLAILAAGFLVRVFIIFHDCGHGSFLQSKRLETLLGFVTGLLTFTPYYHWRWEHAQHHGSAGNLDRRGLGDVWTMTVQEYLEASRWKRFAYRLLRNPAFLFVVAPLFLFLVLERFPSSKAPARERRSVYWTNLALAAMVLGMGWLFGFRDYLIIQLTVLTLAASAGVWLFYVQHQFEGTYWARHEDWDLTEAALKGSSFYQLPRVLQWFSGNIGFHHIHHLSSRIPNYRLEECHRSHPLFQTVKPITLLSSLKSFTYRLWDEQQQKLVSFRHLRSLRRASQSRAPQ